MGVTAAASVVVVLLLLQQAVEFQEVVEAHQPRERDAVDGATVRLQRADNGGQTRLLGGYTSVAAMIVASMLRGADAKRQSGRSRRERICVERRCDRVLGGRRVDLAASRHGGGGGQAPEQAQREETSSG